MTTKLARCVEDEQGVPEEEDKKRDADVEALHDELVVFAQDADADAHVARVEAREEDDGGRVGRFEREEEQERGQAGEARGHVRADPEHERRAVLQAAPEHAPQRRGHVAQAQGDPRVGEDDEDDAGDGDVEQGQVHVGVQTHVYTRESTCSISAHLVVMTYANT